MSSGLTEIIQNNGKIAFQHVFHVHFHVIPKPSLEQGAIFRIEDYAHKVERPKEELLQVRKFKSSLTPLGWSDAHIPVRHSRK